IPISTAMIAITTSSSTSVYARRCVVVKKRDIAAPLSETAAVGRILSIRTENRSAMDSLTLRDFAQRRQVPNLDGKIAASRDQPPVVGAERHAADKAGVTAEGVDHLSRVAV